MRMALIANPLAAGGRSFKRLAPYILKRLNDHKIDYQLFISQFDQHVVQLSRELDPQRYDAIVCIGGDGTNFQMLNGLLSGKRPTKLPPLAIIPIGRGNSFAKDLAINNIDEAIAAIVVNQHRAIDLCSYTQGEELFYFANLMGFGFVTDVAIMAQKFSYLGDISYVIGVLLKTLNLTCYEMEIEIDGQFSREKNCFVEICNSRYTGGKMLMAPLAKIDDGFFDVVITSPLSRRSLISTFPKLFKGTHYQNQAVRFVKAKCVHIKTNPSKVLLPDGEIQNHTPTTVKICPQLVRYFCLGPVGK